MVGGPSSAPEYQTTVVATDAVAELCPLGGEPRCRRSRCQEGCEPSNGRARGRVEEEVVAGGDDDEHHERRVERSDRADEQASTVAEQSDGNEQRVDDAHAGHRGVQAALAALKAPPVRRPSLRP
jgi:hypothetical protein